MTGSHRVRRAAIAVVLTAALIPPATAPAGVIGYSGSFEPGGKLSFGLKEVDGKRYVTAWTWRRLPVTCAHRERVTSGYYTFKMRVRHREFGGRAVLRADSGRIIGGAKVRGEFGPGYETASGKFRVYGRTPEGYRRCESGRVRWTAAVA